MKILKTDIRLINIKKERFIIGQIRKALEEYPIVMITGPRKVGKTTALLQLAVNDETAEYIDCGITGDVNYLEKIVHEGQEGLYLIDEFQKLKRHSDWIQAFHNISADNTRIKFVITGSIAAYTTFVSRVKGGGRNRLLHLPYITYLEYLYFMDVIKSYDVDLSKVEYGDSFLD